MCVPVHVIMGYEDVIQLYRRVPDISLTLFFVGMNYFVGKIS